MCPRVAAPLRARATDRDREHAAVSLPRLQDVQAVAADERIGRRRHRLEADEVASGRGVHLRIWIALHELDFDRGIARGGFEHGGVCEAVESVVEARIL